MRVEIRKVPFDLYVILAVSTLLLIIIFINEIIGLELSALRVVLGLPFILFFPGYMLISALYPEAKRYFDANGEPIEPPTDGDEREEKDEEDIKGKGLDGLERMALSLGLSIAITPLIGLILNWTYDWDPEHLGIRLVPILASQYGFIVITGIIAIRRRLSVDLEDRFSITIDLGIPSDYTLMDKVLTIGIVIMMVLSVGMLIYIIVVPREGESFTELYVLGPGGMADDYPRNIYLEEEHLIYIGIGNHEHRDVNYTIVMTIDDQAGNSSVSALDHVTLSRSQQPSMEIMVKEGKTRELSVNFSILEVGVYKMRILLFLDDSEYRDVHLWLKVFEEKNLKRSADGSLEFYLMGPEGDPSAVPDPFTAEGPVIFSLGFRNMGGSEMDINLTVQYGTPSEWYSLSYLPVVNSVTKEKGAFTKIQINASSSLDPLEFALKNIEDHGSIRFKATGEGSDLTIIYASEGLG